MAEALAAESAAAEREEAHVPPLRPDVAMVVEIPPLCRGGPDPPRVQRKVGTGAGVRYSAGTPMTNPNQSLVAAARDPAVSGRRQMCLTRAQ